MIERGKTTGGGEGGDHGSREAAANGLSAVPFPPDVEANLATVAESPRGMVGKAYQWLIVTMML